MELRTYDSLQLQFRRRLVKGLQARRLIHGLTRSIPVQPAPEEWPAVTITRGKWRPMLNRGPSDFDPSNTASAALTYEISPPLARNRFCRGPFARLVDAKHLSDSLGYSRQR